MRSTKTVMLLPTVLAILAGCGPGGGADQMAAVSATSASASTSAQSHPFEVLSRNLYLGAALDPAVAATNAPAFLAATTAIWEKVVANDFHVRAFEVAQEIATIQPELVALQEAFLWRTGDLQFDGSLAASTVAYDYVGELLAALEERGLPYDAVVTLPLFDFEAPTLLGFDVRLTDRQVILARRGVETANPRSGVYSVLLPLTVMGKPVQVDRGWTAVDVTWAGRAFTFFDTHLESFYAPVRVAQAMELAQIVNATPGPLVLAGDLNSLPGTEGEAVLTAPPSAGGAGLADAWGTLHPNLPGLTCCFPELLSDPARTLDQRIDYVLLREVRPLTARVFGDVLGDRAQAGLWPSDHAGLTASLRLGR
jgi:endonuclease/exonuclease/phosphatase family metal-dependent hydrolase